MPDYCAFLMMLIYPAIFAGACTACLLKYRAERIQSEEVGMGNPMRLLDGLHPATVCVLAGHPDVVDDGCRYVVQVFDGALATLLSLVERGIVRCYRGVEQEHESHGEFARANNRWQLLNRDVVHHGRKDFLLRYRGIREDMCELDRLAINVFFPDGCSEVAFDTILARIKRRRDMSQELRVFRGQLEEELRRDGFTKAPFSWATALGGVPFRILVVWLIASVMIWGVSYGVDSPWTIGIAAMVVLTPIPGVLLPLRPMLTKRGFEIGRTALVLRDTMLAGARIERLERMGASDAEAIALHYAEGYGEKPRKSAYFIWRAKTQAWTWALLLSVCAGDLRSGDGPQGFTQACRKIGDVAAAVPARIAQEQGLERVLPWYRWDDEEGGGVPPAAVTLHDAMVSACGDTRS